MEKTPPSHLSHNSLDNLKEIQLCGADGSDILWEIYSLTVLIVQKEKNIAGQVA